MSGIAGYIGRRQARPVILDALERLEYRGYDSAGLAVITEKGGLKAFRTLGRPIQLVDRLATKDISGNIGIGHTRWASHGKPSIRNAHPVTAGETAVVHNGGIREAGRLRRLLASQGVRFRSETDTEIIPYLINRNWKGNLLDSVIETLKGIDGVLTFCAVSSRDPDCLVAVRKGNPLVVGFGEGELIVASDATAVAPYTDRVIFMEDGEVAHLTREGAQFFDMKGKAISRQPRPISWEVVRSEKKGYRHFLLKEIVESPRAVRDTLAESIPMAAETASPDDFNFQDIGDPSRVIFLGSGSSYFAAMYGQLLCESLAGISTGRKVSSEFRFGGQIVEKDALYVAISQSGESLDTIESAQLVKESGARLMAISNQMDCTLGRMADFPFYTKAGPEVSVVSSKTFSATLAALALLGFHLGRQNGNLGGEEQESFLKELRSIPEKMELTITHETLIRRIAEQYSESRSFFFTGRGLMYPLAHYAGLTIKEVVNAHGEAVLSGEFKHGTMSMVEEGMPVVFFANQNSLVDRSLNEMDELMARGVEVVSLGNESMMEMAYHCHRFIPLPETDDRLAPMVAIAPAQLFIYYLGLYNRKDVDRPRNIAKSVTV